MTNLERARVLWEGKSLLNGDPIVVIAIPDSNPKTGPMLYTYILHREIPPTRAAYTGADQAVCGDCKFRALLEHNSLIPVRPCYVRLSSTYQGDHPPADEEMPPEDLWDAYKLGEIGSGTSAEWAGLGVGYTHGMMWEGDLPVRLGSYGDPAAVPTEVWDTLVWGTETWTGYTHAWNNPNTSDGLRFLCMASVDTLEERALAQDLGWRTFFVSRDGTGPEDDIFCPMSAGTKRGNGEPVKCATCLLCSGRNVRTKSIWEKVHGPAQELHNNDGEGAMRDKKMKQELKEALTQKPVTSYTKTKYCKYLIGDKVRFNVPGIEKGTFEGVVTGYVGNLIYNVESEEYGQELMIPENDLTGV